MKLSETWYMDGYIDFELQKYRLLAYLQEVNKYFSETKLYPQLADIIFHYNNLVSLRDNKKMLQEGFPKAISNIDVQKLKLTYEEMLKDNEVMSELENIIQYAIDEMKSTINNGAELYEHVEKQLRIHPVGILPLYKNEGYMLLHYNGTYEVRAYAYVITLFEHQAARYKGLKMTYLDSWNKSIANTYEQIKREIIRINRDLPNPAVYCIESNQFIPFTETLLPVAKRLLARSIEQDAI